MPSPGFGDAPAGSTLADGVAIKLTLGEAKREAVRMPDLVGRNLSAALVALSRSSLKVRFRGQGRVVRQDPAAGAAVGRGTIVDLTLSTK